MPQHHEMLFWYLKKAPTSFFSDVQKYDTFKTW